MYLLESAYFIETTARAEGAHFLVRSLGAGRSFVAMLSDASHMTLVHESIESLLHSEGSLSFRSLLMLLGRKSTRWPQVSAHFLLFDSQVGDMQHFSLNAPSMLIKAEGGGVERLGANAAEQLDESSVLIERVKTAHVATLFCTLDSRLALLVENHLPYCFSKKEIIDVLARFTDEEEAMRFDFLFLNHEIARNRRLSRQDAIDANLDSIMTYEEKLEELFEKYVGEDPAASTNTMLIFNELIINALEHGALGIDQATKQQLMSEGSYESYIEELQEQVDAKLHVALDFYSGGMVRVAITDEGRGFDYESHLQKMEELSVGAYRGRGLIMAHQIATAVFYSNQGRTVTFFMRFKGEAQEESIELGDETLLRSMTVLYVEDDNFIRTHVAHLLKRAVRNLLLAENGQVGVELFERYRPDIVVTDVEMPIMGGLEMAEQIKALDRDTPLIVTTAYNTEEFFIRAIDAGVDKFLSKPIRVPNLRRTLYDFARSVYLKNQAKEQLRLKEAAKESLIEDLHTQNRYARSQQQAALAKQQLVLRDESDRLQEGLSAAVWYRPLETLSGDVYGVMPLDQNQTFIYLVDSMGKGLPASVTAILSAAFINRAAKLSVERGGFRLDKALADYSGYIRDYLLAEECVSFTMALIDREKGELSWASAGMYPVLLKQQGRIETLKEGDPPFGPWGGDVAIHARPLDEEFMLLLYSDGVVEHEALSPDAIEQLLSDADDAKGVHALFEKRVEALSSLDDDTTLIALQGVKGG